MAQHNIVCSWVLTPQKILWLTLYEKPTTYHGGTRALIHRMTSRKAVCKFSDTLKSWQTVDKRFSHGYTQTSPQAFWYSVQCFQLSPTEVSFLPWQAGCLQFCGTSLRRHLSDLWRCRAEKHKLQILCTSGLDPHLSNCSWWQRGHEQVATAALQVYLKALHCFQHLPNIHTDSLQSISSFGLWFLVSSKLSFVKAAIQSEVSGIAFPAGSGLSSVPPSTGFHLILLQLPENSLDTNHINKILICFNWSIFQVYTIK